MATRGIFGIASGVLMLSAFNAYAESTYRVESGFYSVSRSNLDEASDLPKDEAGVFVYGRTNTVSPFEYDNATFLGRNRPTFEAEAEWRRDFENVHEPREARIAGHLYLPFWSAADALPFWDNNQDFQRGSHGKYDPDYLPPLTLGFKAQAARLNGIGSSAGSSGSIDEKSYAVFLRPHWWFELPDSAGGSPYSDLTLDLAAEWIDSERAESDGTRTYATALYRRNYKSRELWGFSYSAESMVQIGYDRFRADASNTDETARFVEAGLRLDLTPQGIGGSSAHLFAAAIAGLVDTTKANARDDSYFYVAPSVFLEWPHDSDPADGRLRTKGTRSNRGGRFTPRR